MAILTISNLMIFYENAVALNNLSMKVDEGKVIGVFGSNSAGKSTFLHGISGLILDTMQKEKMRGGERITVLGKIVFKDEDITTLRPSKRARKGIVLCPERRRVFAESTALENLKMGAYLASRSQAKETLDYIFELFPPLWSGRHRQAGFLSGGEQQMLAIGRALMAQPKLLLLDEPLLGLSPLMEEKLGEAITDINQRTRITIIVAEQYARPILPLIDFGYVMENGSAVLEGTSDDLMENPDVKAAYFGI